tara:strand:+ start:150 stop:392 length:243 start_codon:yes stop_codon:yes gene_type:complete
MLHYIWATLRLQRSFVQLHSFSSSEEELFVEITADSGRISVSNFVLILSDRLSVACFLSSSAIMLVLLETEAHNEWFQFP